jgi:membrane glycosyltransferase
LPKLLSVLVIIIKGGARAFGGVLRLLLSVLAEVIFSTLFAPVRMLFHSKFVFITLLGQQVGWGSQQRSDLGTGWGEAARFHGAGTVVALLWGILLFLVNRSFFWWNMPVFIPVILSIPLSVCSSRASLGRYFRRLGLFITPEEVAPPPEVQNLERKEEQQIFLSSLPMEREAGFVRAVVDPKVNFLHRSLLRKERTVAPSVASRRQQLQDKAIAGGPESLSVKEKKELLYDPRCMEELHHKVWEITDRAQAAQWSLAA